MTNNNSMLTQLAGRIKRAQSVEASKKAQLDLAQQQYIQANEALFSAQWDYDDFIVQSWDHPDISVLLNSVAGDRFYQELRRILKSDFEEALSIGGLWDYPEQPQQHIINIYMDAGIPGHVEKAEAGILFFYREMFQTHPDAPGCAVFPVVHTRSQECAYELWYIPVTGQAILAKRVDQVVIDQQQFSTVRECLTFIYDNLSYNFVE